MRSLDDWLAYISAQHPSAIAMGLDRVREVFGRMALPALPTVITVGGTNGKGSTCAMLERILLESGYRVGLYTSPHLLVYNERVRIQGEDADDATLVRGFEAVEAARGDTQLTYFEYGTLAAFHAFAHASLDAVVLEVGLGGRLDAVNIVDADVAIVVSVDLDHQAFLGPDRESIGFEKAGIFRRDRPAIAWVEEPEAAASLREVAAEVGARLTFAPDKVRIEEIAPEPGDQRVRLATSERRYDLRIALLGEHQARNLGLAVLAAEFLESRFERIDAETIARGVASCRWPGRLEEVILPDGRRVLFDAAHNAEGVEVLAAHFDRTGERPDLLFGVLQDKDAAQMLGRLAPRAGRIVLTSPASARARPPQEVAALLGDREGVEVEPDRGRALDRALALGGDLLAVCGSIYLIGEIRRELRERFGVPAAATEPLS